VQKVSEFVNSAIGAREAIQNLENFQSVLENIIDRAKENLVYEYDNEMNRLETILDDNDRMLDELENSMAQMVWE
jgi:hypothetical protein